MNFEERTTKEKVERLRAFFQLRNEGNTFTENGLRTVYNFYDKYELDDDFMFEAMDYACRRVPDSDIEGKFRYYCFLCWKKINPDRYAEKSRGTEKIVY